MTTIEPFAFCMQESLKKIVLHNGITSICGAAFMACSALKEVVIPKYIKEISCDCFDGCTSLMKVVLPDGLERIGARAFYPASLSRVVFPASLNEIESEAFYHNKRLRSIEFKSKVENIDLAAFACCPLLFRNFITKPEDMDIADNVFVEDPGLDKYGFWD